MRKIIQIALTNDEGADAGIAALCDDGSLWFLLDRWRRMADIPQDQDDEKIDTSEVEQGESIKDLLTSLVVQHGGIRAAARAKGIDAGYFKRLMDGEKLNPSQETLERLGLSRFIKYKKMMAKAPEVGDE